MIQEKMRASQSRQKSYHDKRRKNLEFQEGDHVFLRVTPTTGVGRALKMRKLTPRFIGPYQILKRVGNVAYQIALPPSLSNLHSVFHVSQLRKYIFDPSHVIESDKVQIKENLTFETLPLRIEDQKSKELRGKTIPLVKVVWGGATGESATWEVESQMRDSYPELFSSGLYGNFGTYGNSDSSDSSGSVDMYDFFASFDYVDTPDFSDIFGSSYGYGFDRYCDDESFFHQN
ncbi:uncharacterized protein [Cicer arietinum]|uniref:uncharacterized protein n=1 Tax=Cicer arietinum TaxID=3827 RepID=UPI003CC6A4C3